MDWEKKFSSIIKDTEANLSRMKNKFNQSGGNVSFAPRSYSTPMKRSTSLLDFQGSSSPRHVQNGFHQTTIPEFNGALSTNPIMPYPTTQALQEKIEQQSIAIEHLTGLVHRLETDRHNYKEQIRDLRNEIFQLTEKATDRRPDPHIERRMEQMRRELLGEIQLLQSQLQISSAKGSNAHLSDTQLMSMSRDVLEVKHAFRDELETYRRDLEVLRSRVSKVELELASFLSGKRDIERRQDNLDRTLNSISVTQNKSPLPSSTVALMNTNKQLERLQINEMRHTLAVMKDKIDLLESSSTPLSSSRTPKPQMFVNGFPGPSKSKSTKKNLLDDLDLSDDGTESSDFTEFEPKGMKESQKISKDPDLETVNTDDLDIDELDLSDDFSDHSLSGDELT